MMGTGMEADGSGRFIMALSEGNDDENNLTNYGVACLDVTTAHLVVGKFQDLTTRTKIRTILAQYQPREVIWLKDHIAPATISALKSDLHSQDLRLTPRTSADWMNPSEARKQINVAKYYQDVEYP